MQTNNTLRTLLICAVILAVAGGVTWTIFSTEPTAVRVEQTRESAMLVDAVRVLRGEYRPVIVAMGDVRAAEEVMLRPRVGGQVVERAPAFTPGATVAAGQVLLRIDPDDYENMLAMRVSELREAEAELAMEQGRRQVAEQEYRLLGEDLPDISTGERALVLREPQQDAARARVASARAAVAQARLELERTEVRSPFAAQVLTREADLGSQLDAGDALGRLVGTATYWVRATVPLAALRWIEIPAPSESMEDAATAYTGPVVQVRDRSAWAQDAYREGRIIELVGELQGTTRLAQLLVAVDAPVAREPRLLLGSYVEARIPGRVISDVSRLARDYLRPDDTVWVYTPAANGQGGELVIRQAEVVFRDATHAYIRDGLNDGDLVVTTNLATVAQGARLRLSGEMGDSSE